MSTKLKYHRRSAELLQRAPRFSKSAEKAPRQREEELGIDFPPSLQEWFSLDGAVQLLERYSNDDSVFKIDELGKPFDDWYGGGPRDFVAERLLLFMHENQGVCNWGIRLDGTPDPAVVVEVDTAPHAEWLLCADCFSTFIWCQIWDHSQREVGVQAQEIELSRDDLRFLKSHFHQHDTTYGWPGSVNYRFSSTNAAILIWDGKDRGVDWFLSTKTMSDLEEVLGKVWHCGNLAQSLYGDGRADKVLQQMRSPPRIRHNTQ